MTTVFIISAPSGSGKSTLVQNLMRNDPRLRFSVSYTTRPPRGQEIEGRDYHFISREEFETQRLQGQFLEFAEVFGNYYGTHRRTLEDARKSGCDLVLDIDVQGARQLKMAIEDAVSIFILAPSRQVLEQRLRTRSEDTAEVIERRLREAAEEIRNYARYDYVLVNDELQESIITIGSIVRAERVRRKRVEDRIRPILATFEENLSPEPHV